MCRQRRRWHCGCVKGHAFTSTAGRVGGISDSLFRLVLSKRAIARMEHAGTVHTSFAVTSALSMLLCLLFALYASPVAVPISLSIVPVILVILYCKSAIGLTLSILHILFYFLFAHPYDLYGFLLHTGILLYPIVWLSAKRFKHNTPSRKMAILIILITMELIVTSLLWIASLQNESTYSATYMILTALGYTAGAIVAGSLSLLWLERMKHYRGLEQHLSEVHHRYIAETEKLHQILNAVPLSIATVDKQGTVIFVNEMMEQTAREQLPCTSTPDLIGQPASQFVEQGQADKMDKSIRRAVVHGEISGLTVRYGAHVFQSRTVPIYAFSTESAREVTGAMLIIQDITELEMLRSELDNVDRLSLVGQMAASITHEVRNPMAVVRGFLQLMQEKSPDSSIITTGSSWKNWIGRIVSLMIFYRWPRIGLRKKRNPSCMISFMNSVHCCGPMRTCVVRVLNLCWTIMYRSCTSIQRKSNRWYSIWPVTGWKP